MQSPPVPESTTFSGNLTTLDWSSDASSDYFIKTLSRIQAAKDVKPDLIASIITHHASKWLPEPETATTSSWTKKKLFIETLIGILPPERDSIPCDFLLRLLRVANMLGVGSGFRAELEDRASYRLDQASLKELTCSTLLDFGLVGRLVKRFLEVSRSGAALMKVAKLLDCYLAEAAVDSHLRLGEFVGLAGVLPGHARSSDDGLYRAIDTYLKAHPGLSKQDRKRVCMLIDSRKLSTEASFHAAQNLRLPVRAVIQVLLSEQNKLSKQIEWSGSLSATRSPGLGLDATTRCHSKRETMTQQMEIKRLKEDVLRLQSRCMKMEMQIEKLLEKKPKGYHFSWKNIGISVFKLNGNAVRHLLGLERRFRLRPGPYEEEVQTQEQECSNVYVI